MVEALKYNFNKTLKEIPINKKMMTLEIDKMIKKFKKNPDFNLASTIGVFSRILKNYDTALYYSRLAYNQNPKGTNNYIRDSLRLAILYQWLENFEESHKIYKDLSKIELGNYLDFYYQHLGKNYFDQKNYLEAKKNFNKALEIRTNKENKDLISSTLYALEITNMHI